MDLDEDQNDESIPDGAVLNIANNILNLLEYSQQLTNEEDLFSDEFYISILSNLLTDKKFDIEPGDTPKEKVKSLNKLIKLLSEIIEMDLSQISAEGIIMEHDKASAKSFLELLEELIKTLMNANLEEEESEKNENEIENKSNKKNKNEEEIKNESYSENNDNYIKLNNSEGNIFGGNKKFNLDDNDIDINNNDEENEINYNNINQKRLNKDEEININDIKKEQEKEEEKNKNKNKSETKNEKSEKNSINNKDKDDKDNLNNSNEEINISGESYRRLNHSNLEKLQIDKMFKNYEDESYVRKTFSQNNLSSYEKDLAEREEEIENENENENENEEEHSKNKEKSKKELLSSQEEEENKFPEGGLDLNYNLNDKNLSDAPIMNVSHISELSQDKSKKEKDNEIEIEKTSEKKENKLSSLENFENSELNKSIKSIKTKSNKSINEKNIETSSKKK